MGELFEGRYDLFYYYWDLIHHWLQICQIKLYDDSKLKKPNWPKIINMNIIFQAEFGSTVVSFFEFLRWTIFLNMFNAFMVLILVFLPQIVENDNDTIPPYSSCSRQGCGPNLANDCFPVENISE